MVLRENGRFAKRHGHTPHRGRSPEHYSWTAMLDRCCNPQHKSWKHYGGRGIRVCERWRDFVAFLADMGPRPSQKHSLDRYPDRSGNYEPGNCRWATRREQATNSSRAHQLTHDGRTLTLTEWSEATGLSARRIGRRIELGWPVGAALTTPTNTRSPRPKFGALSHRVETLRGEALASLVRAVGGGVAQNDGAAITVSFDIAQGRWRAAIDYQEPAGVARLLTGKECATPEEALASFAEALRAASAAR